MKGQLLCAQKALKNHAQKKKGMFSLTLWIGSIGVFSSYKTRRNKRLLLYAVWFGGELVWTVKVGEMRECGRKVKRDSKFIFFQANFYCTAAHSTFGSADLYKS